MGWQSMDSVPRDETEILLKCWINEAADVYSVCKGFWSEEYQDWFEFDSSSNPLYNKPSFWMLIPTGKEGEIIQVLYDAVEFYESVSLGNSIAEEALAKAEELAGEV
jgi:hypothetical protein